MTQNTNFAKHGVFFRKLKNSFRMKFSSIFYEVDRGMRNETKKFDIIAWTALHRTCKIRDWSEIFSYLECLLLGWNPGGPGPGAHRGDTPMPTRCRKVFPSKKGNFLCKKCNFFGKKGNFLCKKCNFFSKKGNFLCKNGIFFPTTKYCNCYKRKHCIPFCQLLIALK